MCALAIKEGIEKLVINNKKLKMGNYITKCQPNWIMHMYMAAILMSVAIFVNKRVLRLYGLGK